MSETTTDHETIRNWAEARNGEPAKVDADGEDGILRLAFGQDDDALVKISWDEWFRIFEENDLALVYQEETGGQKSQFNKIVSR